MLRSATPPKGYSLDQGRLRRFYERRKFAPAWTSDPRAVANAAIAVAILQGSDSDGLSPATYHLDAIAAWQHSNSPHATVELDVLLTGSMLAYIHDMRMGRVSADQAGFAVDLPSTGFDPVAFLTDALTDNRVSTLPERLAPPHPEYIRLKEALARYRKVAVDGGWPNLFGTRKIALGSADPRIPALRRRLEMEGQGGQGDPSEEGLVEEIRRYQLHHGLEADGIAGRRTLESLNISASARADQIVANMERWRWLAQPFEERYVEVNAADATLIVMDRDKPVLTSRVITGKPATPTPIFKAAIVAVTVNPSWNIPETIASKEIRPKERLTPGYLDSQHIVADLPGGGLRQLPGDDNALGHIKLEMPNRFNSYVHNTPAQVLFRQNDRHFSHGCIRAEQILPLASFVLSGDTTLAVDKIRDAIATGETQRFSLERPVPIYVLYWTAMVDEDGVVEFRRDVYGWDAKLLAALGAPSPTGRMSMLTECSNSGRG